MLHYCYFWLIVLFLQLKLERNTFMKAASFYNEVEIKVILSKWVNIIVCWVQFHFRCSVGVQSAGVWNIYTLRISLIQDQNSFCYVFGFIFEELNIKDFQSIWSSLHTIHLGAPNISIHTSPFSITGTLDSGVTINTLTAINLTFGVKGVKVSDGSQSVLQTKCSLLHNELQAAMRRLLIANSLL